jgi:hypothetical protein
MRQCDVMFERQLQSVVSLYLHMRTEEVSLVLIMISAQSEALA